jgi:hypothetical protein
LAIERGRGILHTPFFQKKSQLAKAVKLLPDISQR